MKIALIGATGFVGTAALAEFLQRGHTVTALVREIPESAGIACAGRAHGYLSRRWRTAIDGG